MLSLNGQFQDDGTADQKKFRRIVWIVLGVFCVVAVIATVV